MIPAISASIPMALGIALSPLPIVAIVMMLMTKRAQTNAPSFLLGWLLGLWTVGAIVILSVDQLENGEPAAVAGYVRIALGVLLLVMAIREWRSRPGPDEPVEVPRLLASLDSFTFKKAMLTGFALVVVHPKNLPLCAAGAAAIDLATQDLTQQLGAYVVFTMIASIAVAFPIVAYLTAREKAEVLFDTWKGWLIANNRAVAAATLLLIGAILMIRGLGIVITT